jgi:hypothetical protein
MITFEELGAMIRGVCDECEAIGIRRPFVIVVTDHRGYWITLQTTDGPTFDVINFDTEWGNEWLPPLRGRIEDRTGRRVSIEYKLH